MPKTEEPMKPGLATSRTMKPFDVCGVATSKRPLEGLLFFPDVLLERDDRAASDTVIAGLGLWLRASI